MDMSELITSFKKSSVEEIRISLLQYREHHFIDFRVFSAPQRGEEKTSTESGITLPVNLFSEFKHSVEEAEKVLVAKRLLGDTRG